MHYMFVTLFLSEATADAQHARQKERTNECFVSLEAVLAALATGCLMRLLLLLLLLPAPLHRCSLRKWSFLTFCSATAAAVAAAASANSVLLAFACCTVEPVQKPTCFTNHFSDLNVCKQ
jgi:hypothetical protein